MLHEVNWKEIIFLSDSSSNILAMILKKRMSVKLLLQRQQTASSGLNFSTNPDSETGEKKRKKNTFYSTRLSLFLSRHWQQFVNSNESGDPSTVSNNDWYSFWFTEIEEQRERKRYKLLPLLSSVRLDSLSFSAPPSSSLSFPFFFSSLFCISLAWSPGVRERNIQEKKNKKSRLHARHVLRRRRNDLWDDGHSDQIQCQKVKNLLLLEFNA